MPSIEQNLTRIANALEDLVAAIKPFYDASPAPQPEAPPQEEPKSEAAPPAKERKKPGPKPKEPEVDATIPFAEARAAVGKVVAAKGAATAKALLAQFGAEKVSEVPEDKREELISAAEEACAA